MRIAIAGRVDKWVDEKTQALVRKRHPVETILPAVSGL
jgi:hypothetical protein